MRRCTCSVGAHQVKETLAPDQICFSLSCTVDVVRDSLMDFVMTRKLELRMHTANTVGLQFQLVRGCRCVLGHLLQL